MTVTQALGHPSGQSKQDLVYLFWIRGEQAERRRNSTQIRTVNLRQYRDFLPLSKLSLQNPVIKIISSDWHTLTRVVALIDHREPGAQNHIKGSGPGILRHSEIMRQRPVLQLGEAPHRFVINILRQFRVLRRLTLLQARHHQCPGQLDTV